MKVQQKRLQLPKERLSVFSKTGTFCASVAMGVAMSLLLLSLTLVKLQLMLLWLCRNYTSW